jgi:hypothetical protein
MANGAQHGDGVHTPHEPLPRRIVGALRARAAAAFTVRTAPLRAELAPALDAALRTRTRAHLAPRADALAAARTDAEAARIALLTAERRVAAALARLDRAPLSSATTVHAAHARHPGVGAVFARHGLPRCTDCAVGADETLAEAAAGEGFSLETLLDELNALLPVFKPASPRPTP